MLSTTWFLSSQFNLLRKMQLIVWHSSSSDVSMCSYEDLSSLLLQIKFVVSSQGRTIPNILHLFAVFVKLNITMDDLILYLDQKYDQQKSRCSQKILGKYETKKLLAKLNDLFQDDIIDRSHQNIISIPQYFVQTFNKPQQWLPVRRSIDECLQKPPIYTYKQELIQVQRHETRQNIARKSAQSQNQMRVALSKHRKIKNDQVVYQVKDSIIKNENNYPNKPTFKFMKYL